MSTLAYRPDIDGTRAIAVTAVVLFHLGFSQLDGGFVGVDVFFVISGYLITSIISRQQEQGTFSFPKFYLARFRRLFPALLTTVLVTFILSAMTLTPDDFQRFARTAVATVFWVSNFVFFMEAGYWDVASESKPLLHTWSLGVEEQFYLFWPALTVICLTWLRRFPFAAIMAVVTAVSFALCIFRTSDQDAAAFFLLPYRVFEFGLGALAIFAERWIAGRGWLNSPVTRDGMFGAGLVLVVGSVLLMGAETPFPGWYALPPCIGTMMLIIAGGGGAQGPVGRMVLCNPVSVWIGRVSYSMYLVHWPVIVLYRYKFSHDPSFLEQLMLGGATVAATALLHFGVEKAFYRRGKPHYEGKVRPAKPLVFTATTLGLSVCLAVVAAHAWLGNGWSWRFPKLSLTPEQVEAGMGDRYVNIRQLCWVRNYPDADPTLCPPAPAIQALVFGNSHEPDGVNFLVGGWPEMDALNIISFGTTNGCSGLDQREGSWTTRSLECEGRLDTLFSPEFAKKLDVVFYAANKPFIGKETFLAMLKDLKQLNPDLKIVTFGGYLNVQVPCARLINETGSTDACAAPKNVAYFEEDPESEPFYEEFAALSDIIIDRTALLCEGRKLENCLTRTEDNVPAFYDQHHLSRPFAEMAGRLYREQNPDFWDRLIEREFDQVDVVGSILAQVIDDHPDDAGRGPEVSGGGAIVRLPDGSSGRIESTRTIATTHLEDGTVLSRQGRVGERTGGNTGVANVELTGDAEAAVSGGRVDIVINGTAAQETGLWLQYSTNEVGNSGWEKHLVGPGDFSLDFSYQVSPMRNGRGDYFGLAPVDADVVIREITLTAVP